MTETWLKESILDSEVLYNFPGYNIFRCDRSQDRQGGGVCLYLRDSYTGEILASLSNSVCELLIVKVHQLNTIVCVVYRPPDTKLSEFREILSFLEETISSLPTPTPNILLMGDFNFNQRSLLWSRDEDDYLVPRVRNYRESVTQEGKQDRQQAQALVSLCEKYFLFQIVDQTTRGDEILDLVFTNNSDLVKDVCTESWEKFTDHKIVTETTSLLVKVKRKKALTSVSQGSAI